MCSTIIYKRPCVKILIRIKLTEMCGNNKRRLRTVTEGKVIKQVNEVKYFGNGMWNME
jgi:hypothetical protein